MNIIIAGCGKIGTTVLSTLASEGHDVLAIDSDQSVISEITNIYDVMAVCGSCTDCETLEEAEIAKAELFVAVTGSDEINMLSCFIAKKMGAKHTIARIRNPEYNDRSLGFLRQQLDLSMSINPDRLTALELFDVLKLPSALKIETFSRRDFEMIELRLKPDSALSGKSLSELRSKYKAKFLICVVQRGEDVFIPDGSFVLKEGDKIGLTADRFEIQKLLRSLNLLQKQAKNVMIMGGSKIAYYLAKMLVSAGSSVKIIEQSRERCEHLAEILPKVDIINGDGAQQELLLEEGLHNMDAFVALTGIDEENVLVSIFAASQNVPKVISKANRPEMASLAVKLGLESTVSPKEATADILSQYARALQNSLGSNIETLYTLMDGGAEALEFNVKNDFRLTNIPLKNLQLKPNTLIAGIIRGRRPIIPGGDDVILTGDKVIVIAADSRYQDLSDIIK
ncbi:MAG: Trk system potassium transporter TrkA [Clostridia bacterium]|nr:Trk system potassium transporter TrkA [Clostridia bacterium]